MPCLDPYTVFRQRPPFDVATSGRQLIEMYADTAVVMTRKKNSGAGRMRNYKSMNKSDGI